MTIWIATATVLAAMAGGGPLAARPSADWLDDYAVAMRQAKDEHKMLLIYFERSGSEKISRRFEKEWADSRVSAGLGRYVRVRLPLDATIRSQGRATRLLDHAAFREMGGQPGLAIIDLENPKEAYYGKVVSTFPFPSNGYYKAPALRVILGLPKGTLTQRTLIYAVRVHPERPASTSSEVSPVLAEEAEQHSAYQARIRLQGHHAWESRFHQINARLSQGGLAEEIVAESWPGESLVEAAVECVDSWRHSPGHWSKVRSRNRAFGYDMKRGSNGVWYATGIFARRG